MNPWPSKCSFEKVGLNEQHSESSFHRKHLPTVTYQNIEFTGNAPTGVKIKTMDDWCHLEFYESRIFGCVSLPRYVFFWKSRFSPAESQKCFSSGKDNIFLNHSTTSLFELLSHKVLKSNSDIDGMDHDRLHATVLLRKLDGIQV